MRGNRVEFHQCPEFTDPISAKYPFLNRILGMKPKPERRSEQAMASKVGIKISILPTDIARLILPAIARFGLLLRKSFSLDTSEIDVEKDGTEDTWGAQLMRHHFH